MEEDGFRILKVSHLDNEERHEAASRPWSFLISWWALQLIFLQLVTEGGCSLPLIGSLLALLVGTLFLAPAARFQEHHTTMQFTKLPHREFTQATGDLDYARG